MSPTQLKVASEVKRKAESILFESDSASSVLKTLHTAFPLKKAKMPKGFKGTHHLTLTDKTLTFNVWWKGYCWTLTPTDISLK